MNDTLSRLAEILMNHLYTTRTRYKIVVFTIACLFFLIYNLTPFLNMYETRNSILNSPGLESRISSIKGLKMLTKDSSDSKEVYQTNESFFLQTSVGIYSKYENGRVITRLTDADSVVLKERFVLFGGFFILGLLIIPIFRTENESKTMRFESVVLQQEKQESISSDEESRDIFEFELNLAKIKAKEYLDRSSVLLGGGIILAFVGVAIFYLTTPSYSSIDSISIFALKTIRPMGVLLFVEAISWFLLRQYRSIVEDYKWLHQIYLRQLNLFLVMKVAEKTNSDKHMELAINGLLKENFGGILKKGETTETIERLKVMNSSDPTEIAKEALIVIGKMMPQSTK